MSTGAAGTGTPRDGGRVATRMRGAAPGPTFELMTLRRPLTPVPRGKDVRCGSCGALHEVYKVKQRVRDEDTANCHVCRSVLDSWNGRVTYTAHLVKAKCARCRRLSLPVARLFPPVGTRELLRRVGWSLASKGALCEKCTKKEPATSGA